MEGDKEGFKDSNIEDDCNYERSDIRKRDNKVFYWEHCGLPHDENYLRRHKWKLSMYEKAGIVSWDNLIVTYGDCNANVDMRIVESEIVNKLM